MPAIIVQFPNKKDNEFSATQWLDEHMGCNVDKLLNGDLNEQKKMNRHFKKRSIKLRAELKNK